MCHYQLYMSWYMRLIKEKQSPALVGSVQVYGIQGLMLRLQSTCCGHGIRELENSYAA
jgi:hypothetical protein